MAGFPLGSVSLSIRYTLVLRWYQVLEELRMYVEELEVAIGDDVFDWDIVDEDFLDGFDHDEDEEYYVERY